MTQGKLDSKKYLSEFFDVITSFEVIEHINNPKEEVEHYAKILRSGGAIYITTPNFNSLSRYILGSNWNVIEYPEHLSYYTVQSLETLFNKNNLNTSKSATTGISISRFLWSMNRKKTASPLIKNDDFARKKIENSFILETLKKAINFLLVITRTGDTLKMLFVKS